MHSPRSCAIFTIIPRPSFLTGAVGHRQPSVGREGTNRVRWLVSKKPVFSPLSWNSTGKIGRIGRHRAEKPMARVTSGHIVYKIGPGGRASLDIDYHKYLRDMILFFVSSFYMYPHRVLISASSHYMRSFNIVW